MAEQVIYVKDDETFDKTVKDGVTLVDFYADWCGPCRMIAPIIEEIASDMKGRARVAKVDVDAVQESARRLDVTSIPTIIFFKDGKEVERVVGVRDKASLLKVLAKYAK